MSQKKKNTSESRRRVYAQRRQARRNVAKNSTIAVVITAVAIVGIFLGRWIVAIGNGYYEAFVEPSETTAAAVRNMKGLVPGEQEAAALEPLLREWDHFAAARLRDEVTAEAEDGALLHGYLYNEGSDVTVVVVLFPSLPVIPITGQGATSKNSSISPVTVMPFFLAFSRTGISGRKPGERKT